MELAEQLQRIAKRYQDAGHAITTEEATKTSLIVPFIQALGYDIYNPLEVVPEFNAELPGTKKGDKIDYVIKKDDVSIMLIECKHHTYNLDIHQESQLLRYFHAIDSSRIAILTNGVKYRFYTDLDNRNKMDTRPFLSFDVTTVTDNESMMKELQRFVKTTFNIDDIMPAAEELKYTGAIKKFLMECMTEPADSLVRVLAEQVYDRPLTEKRRNRFKEIAKKSLNQFINERVNDRLNSAIKVQQQEQEQQIEEDEPQSTEPTNDDSGIVTTQSELDAYSIIKAILCKHVPVKRIVMRDTVSYCGILLDNINRRPIARLYFNNEANKQIGLFDSDKKETRHPVNAIDDIYNLADALVTNVKGICEKWDKKGSDNQEDSGETTATE